MNELKSCPFCGSTANFALTGSGWFVHCENCGGAVGSAGSGFSTQQAAYNAWNRRTGEVTVMPATVSSTVTWDYTLTSDE